MTPRDVKGIIVGVSSLISLPSSPRETTISPTRGSRPAFGFLRLKENVDLFVTRGADMVRVRRRRRTVRVRRATVVSSK